MAEQELDKKLREALKADFDNLYVKEFTTDWKNQRLFRNIEIGIMDLKNTLKLIKGRGK